MSQNTDPFPTPRGALSPDGVSAAAPCRHFHRSLDTFTNRWWCNDCGLVGGAAGMSQSLGVPGYAGANATMPDGSRPGDPTPEPQTLRDAAIALDDRLARWVDRHWTLKYPFQPEWLALHKALYGHDRTKVLSPCEGEHR